MQEIRNETVSVGHEVMVSLFPLGGTRFFLNAFKLHHFRFFAGVECYKIAVTFAPWKQIPTNIRNELA